MFSWTLDLRRALVRKERQRDADAERLARERMEVATFCSQVLEPALDDLKAEFEKLGKSVTRPDREAFRKVAIPAHLGSEALSYWTKEHYEALQALK